MAEDGSREAQTGLLRRGLSMVVLGPRLDRAISKWFAARRAGDELPEAETIELTGAVVRRVLRVGFVYLVIALVPTSLLVWQILVMKDQTRVMVTQADTMAEQTKNLVTQLQLQRDQNTGLNNQLKEQVKASRNSEIADYFKMLIEGDDKPAFWVAISYFSGFPANDEFKREVLSRLARMLIEGRGLSTCVALRALALLVPEGKRAEPFSAAVERNLGVSAAVTRDIGAVVRDAYPNQDGFSILEINCPQLRLIGVTLRGFIFVRGNLQGVAIHLSDLEGTRFEGTNMRRAYLDSNYGPYVLGEGVDLSSAYVPDFPENAILVAASDGMFLHWSNSLSSNIRRNLNSGSAVCVPQAVISRCFRRVATPTETPVPTFCSTVVDGKRLVLGASDKQELDACRAELSSGDAPGLPGDGKQGSGIRAKPPKGRGK